MAGECENVTIAITFFTEIRKFLPSLLTVVKLNPKALNKNNLHAFTFSFVLTYMTPDVYYLFFGL